MQTFLEDFRERWEKAWMSVQAWPTLRDPESEFILRNMTHELIDKFAATTNGSPECQDLIAAAKIVCGKGGE